MLNLTTRPSFHTLLDAITLTAVDDTPPALIYLETDKPPIAISRRELRERAASYARALQQLGIRPRDLLIIAHTQNLESIYAFWGAMLMGAMPAMFPTLTEKLDPDVYMRHLAELVQLSGVKAVLTTDEFAPQLRTVVGCQVFGSMEIGDSSSNLQSPISQYPNPQDTAFLQHSSGTTGLQKGVALAHTAVLNQLAAYSDALQLNAQDVVVSWLPLYHDMGLIAGFLLPLVQGIPLVLMSPFDWVSHPALLLRAIHDYQGTLCWLPNFAYNHCARRIRERDKAGLSLASMRLFVNCSEPVRHDSHQLFLATFAANGVKAEMLGVSYAMAENTFAVTQTKPGETAVLDTIDEQELTSSGYAKPVDSTLANAAVKLSCGQAIEGTAVRVLDDNDNPLPDRSVGELAIQSNCMLTGYYQRPDMQPFTNGWFRTGDRGYLVNGEVFVIGRAKEIIINAGKNIYPQDIEAIVNGVMGVHVGRAVVFGVADDKEGTELIVVVAEVQTDDPEERRDIARAIRQEVARQSEISLRYVHLVSPKWLLKTSSGKIARAASREKWWAEVGNRY
jgi:acyl-CoA synthetase (AMP-forming)/AMP-acid ligase II